MTEQKNDLKEMEDRIITKLTEHTKDLFSSLQTQLDNILLSLEDINDNIGKLKGDITSYSQGQLTRKNK